MFFLVGIKAEVRVENPENPVYSVFLETKIVLINTGNGELFHCRKIRSAKLKTILCAESLTRYFLEFL